MRLVDRVIALRIAAVLSVFPLMVTAFLVTMLALKRGSYALGLLSGPVMLGLAYGALRLPRWRERSLRRRLLETDFGLCPVCGYPAAGRGDGACPECGDNTPPAALRAAWERELALYWPEVFAEQP